MGAWVSNALLRMNPTPFYDSVKLNFDVSVVTTLGEVAGGAEREGRSLSPMTGACPSSPPLLTALSPLYIFKLFVSLLKLCVWPPPMTSLVWILASLSPRTARLQPKTSHKRRSQDTALPACFLVLCSILITSLGQ